MRNFREELTTEVKMTTNGDRWYTSAIEMLEGNFDTYSNSLVSDCIEKYNSQLLDDIYN